MTDGSEDRTAARGADGPGALDGLVVLDLTRILAGPTCTQLLGDLGADVIKIERPGVGDDTRAWGPPFSDDLSPISAYFAAANRNKRSVALDITSTGGQAMVRALAAHADVVVENFKPGGLQRYGLDQETLRAAHPGLIWCAITGYGQTGPNRKKPGYDLMAQGYGGIMSLTGASEGPPMKVGVGVADVMCGMYAAVGILAALRHRNRTGEGQVIDVALVDTQMAWLINEGVNTLVSGRRPERRGNGHPNIVPYDVFEAADGHVIVAVGNDAQFARLCQFLGMPLLATHPDYQTNPARVENRAALTATIAPQLAALPACEIIAGLEALGVPVGPIHAVDEALSTDQARARGMVVEMARPGGAIPLLGNPLKMSHTPVRYDLAPPDLGADTDTVLAEVEARASAYDPLGDIADQGDRA